MEDFEQNQMNWNDGLYGEDHTSHFDAAANLHIILINVPISKAFGGEELDEVAHVQIQGHWEGISWTY